MPWVVVGENPIPMVTVLVAMFWTRRYLREEFVTAEVIWAVFAVVTEPKRVVREPLGIAPTVTVPEIERGFPEPIAPPLIFVI